MDTHILKRFRDAFDAAFTSPFTSHRCQSARGRSHWVELEGLQGALAGPLLAIVTTGGCEYVYARNDSYFEGVIDPPGLKIRLLEWHAQLAVGVERFAPTCSTEMADLAFMRSVTTRIRELVDEACEVEQTRRPET